MPPRSSGRLPGVWGVANGAREQGVCRGGCGTTPLAPRGKREQGIQGECDNDALGPADGPGRVREGGTPPGRRESGAGVQGLAPAERGLEHLAAGLVR